MVTGLVRTFGLLSVSVVPALIGCSSSTVTDIAQRPVDGPMAGVVVYGFVTSPQSRGIAQVSVVVEARVQGACTNPRMTSDSVISDATGRYRALLSNWGTEFTVCVNARVTGGGIVRDSSQRTPVVLRSASLDSVRLDIPVRLNP
jgi:hypothetical protein